MKPRSNCKYHSDQSRSNCHWCRRWHKTYRYFRDLKAKELNYYWIIMKHYKTGESFQKIGLTMKEVEERFKEDSERFSIQTMLVRKLPLYAAVTIENHVLHQLHLQKRNYNPKARLSGWTECFI